MAKSIAKRAKEVKAKKIEKPGRFPRTLYRYGGKELWGGKIPYSSILVKDEKELDDAVDDGFIDSFEKALVEPTLKEETRASKERNVKEDDF